jgi:hypothetical protein
MKAFLFLAFAAVAVAFTNDKTVSARHLPPADPPTVPCPETVLARGGSAARDRGSHADPHTTRWASRARARAHTLGTIESAPCYPTRRPPLPGNPRPETCRFRN